MLHHWGPTRIPYQIYCQSGRKAQLHKYNSSYPSASFHSSNTNRLSTFILSFHAKYHIPTCLLFDQSTTTSLRTANMSELFHEFKDVPQEFFKDGTQFINRCTKRTYSPTPGISCCRRKLSLVGNMCCADTCASMCPRIYPPECLTTDPVLCCNRAGIRSHDIEYACAARTHSRARKRREKGTTDNTPTYGLGRAGLAILFS